MMWRMTAEPMKPAPPVTNSFIWSKPLQQQPDHSHSNKDASANSKPPQPPHPQPATPPLHPPQPAAYSVESDNAPLSARPQPSTSPAHPHGSQPSPCIAPRLKHCALQ